MTTSGEPIAASVGPTIEATRTEVLAALRALLEGDDRLLQSALFARRVARRRVEDGQTMWLPALTEGMPLADMVLSFVAADMLRGRTDYDEGLIVCDRCGIVRVDGTAASRRSCAAHGLDAGRISDVVAKRSVEKKKDCAEG